MKTIWLKQVSFLLILAGWTHVQAAESLPPLKTLLVDGQNNHEWKTTTPVLKSALEKAHRFQVSLATSPPTSADAAAWEAFHPVFSDYDVVVSNFSDFGAKPSPTRWLADLVKYVWEGGAVVIVHAATSGMDHYPEYARLVGMGWHTADLGACLTVDASGKTIRTPKGEGPGTAHGAPFSWPVTLWATNHPVCAGLPRVWTHEIDELWASPRGPAQEVEVLGTAVAPQTSLNEPVIWTVRYGKGRVFVTLMGHDARAMTDPGFQAILARGCEWAATGKVTQPIPADFPAR